MEQNFETHGADSPPSTGVRSPQYEETTFPVRTNGLETTYTTFKDNFPFIGAQPCAVSRTARGCERKKQKLFLPVVIVVSPHGGFALPTRGMPPPYTEGRVSLHGGFYLPTRGV